MKISGKFKKNIAADRLKTFQEALKTQQNINQPVGNVEITEVKLSKAPNKAAERLKIVQENLKANQKKEAAENLKKAANVATSKSPKIRPNPPKPKLPKLDPKKRAEVQMAAEKLKTPVKKSLEVKKCSPKSKPAVLKPSPKSKPEPMDWDAIPEEIILNEIATIRNNNLPFDDEDEEMKVLDEAPNKEPDINLDDFETMEQYLNYKALLLADNFDATSFFLIVDTNVFISDLTLCERLPTSYFPKTRAYPQIVVPYVVIQELDKLKMHRSNESLASKAQSAISVLNQKLVKGKSSGFVGQSTMEDATTLIEVENADDRILNCALQKQKLGNVVLLSNDINLRNKAIVNSVDAFSTRQLLDKQETLDFL